MKGLAPLATRFVAALIVAVFGAAAVAAEQTPTSANPAGAKFLQTAAEKSSAEIALAELARKRAEDAEVRELAKLIQRDHNQALDRLQSLASRKGVQLPKERDATRKRALARLSTLEGAEFSRAYVRGRVKSHRKDINAFEKQAQGAKDSDIRAFAEETLPVLRVHLERARGMHRAIVDSKSTDNS